MVYMHRHFIPARAACNAEVGRQVCVVSTGLQKSCHALALPP